MRQALAFLTPIGGSAAPTPQALRWFPLVGALIGAAVGAVWWAAGSIWPLAVAAALAVVADLALTGMLHVDGLADTADGLLPPVDTERRLEIMRDPRSGVFGVSAVVAVLLCRFAALASVAPTATSILLVAAVWCTSRTAMAVTATTVPYARSRGLATAFQGDTVAPIVVTGVPLALVLGFLGATPGLLGILAVVGTALAAAAVVFFARSRIGGFTGDVLGACGVIGETVGLLIIAVRP